MPALCVFRLKFKGRGMGMSNGNVCSVKMTINGEKIPFSSHAMFVRVGDTIRRVRHRRDLPAGSSHLVMALPKGYDDPFSIAQGVLLSIKDDFFGVSFDPSALPAGSIIGRCYDARPTLRPLPDGRVLTGEGGWGHKTGALSELQALSMSDRAQDSFYESAEARAARRTELVRELVEKDPSALLELVNTLRTSEKLRTPAIILAVDAMSAGASNSRSLLTASMLRPDDPGVALRYFLDSNPGKPLPAALKKALADAAQRLYTENSVIKYDRARRRAVHDRSLTGRPVMFRDVINLSHPTPTGEKQAALFKHLVSGNTDAKLLPHLAATARFGKLSPSERLRELEHEAAHVAQAVREGRHPTSFLSRLSVSDLSALCGQPRADIRAAEAAHAAAKAEFEAVVAAHADTRRSLRRLETRLNDATRKRRDVTRSMRTVSSLGPTETSELTELTQTVASIDRRIGSLRAELSRMKASEEVVAYQSDRRAAISGVRNTSNALKAVRKAPGVVPVPVWQVTLPTMSVSETLSNLGAMGRSGVSGEIRDIAESRLLSEEAWSGSSAKIADIMRAVRGTALAEHAGTAPASRPGVLYADSPLWSSLPPSSWETVFEQVASRAVAEQLPEIKSRVLVLVDGSGSMSAEVAGRRNDLRAEGYHSLNCAEVASFAASAIASRGSGNVDVFTYDTTATRVEPGALSAGVIDGARNTTEQFSWGGTDTFSVLQQTWDNHDLVVVLTDEQTHWTLDQPAADSGYRMRSNTPVRVPSSTRVITVNLAGYEAAQAKESERFVRLAGFSESLYAEIARLDAEAASN